jgi:hypothetical protein
VLCEGDILTILILFVCPKDFPFCRERSDYCTGDGMSGAIAFFTSCSFLFKECSGAWLGRRQSASHQALNLAAVDAYVAQHVVVQAREFRGSAPRTQFRLDRRSRARNRCDQAD